MTHSITLTMGATVLMAGTPALAQDYTLRMHHPGAPGHPYTMGMERFQELLDEKTDGRIALDIFPNNELAAGSKAIQAVQFGTVDIALESTMSMSNFIPEMGVINLPFLFPDRETAYAALDGELGDKLEDLSEEGGLKVLAWCDNGFRNISNSKRPINTPEDVAGLKIRVPESEVFIATFEALGAIPTPMAFSELFTALQLGTVDGQENPNGHLIEFSLYEVQDYYAITNHIYTAEPIVVTTEFFDGLEEDLQTALSESAIQACDYERELTAEKADGYLEQIKEQGIEVTTPDTAPFQEKVSGVYDRFREDYGDLIDIAVASAK